LKKVLTSNFYTCIINGRNKVRHAFIARPASATSSETEKLQV